MMHRDESTFVKEVDCQYRDCKYTLLTTYDSKIRICISGRVLKEEFESTREASAYVRGLVDGWFDDNGEYE